MCDSRRPAEGADSESVPRGNRPANEAAEWLRQELRESEYLVESLDAALRAERLAADELLQTAWGVIANAGWDGQERSPGWQEAAEQWRDSYHAYLDEVGVAGLTEEPSPAEIERGWLEEQARIDDSLDNDERWQADRQDQP